MIAALRKKPIDVDRSVVDEREKFVLSRCDDIFNHRRFIIGYSISNNKFSIFSLEKSRTYFHFISRIDLHFFQNDINISGNQLRDLLTFIRLYGIICRRIIAKILMRRRRSRWLKVFLSRKCHLPR